MSVFILIIGKTLRIKLIESENFKKLKSQNPKKNFIYALWHNRSFILTYFYRHKNFLVLTSLSQDGEYQTRNLENLGYQVIRGTNKKEGAKVLRKLIKLSSLNSSGFDCVFAVDGPIGPLYEIKPGIFYLAQKTKSIIVPITSASSLGKVFHKAWDKYFLPFPFTKAAIVVGEPISITIEDKEEVKIAQLKKELNSISKKAEKIVKCRILALPSYCQNSN